MTLCILDIDVAVSGLVGSILRLLTLLRLQSVLVFHIDAVANLRKVDTNSKKRIRIDISVFSFLYFSLFPSKNRLIHRLESSFGVLI